MRIAVIGAGAMGSVYGGLLARSGHAVTLVDTWAEHVDAIRRNGLRLDGIGGDLTIACAAATDVAPDSAELAIVLTDANATPAAAEAAARALTPSGFAVTFQNGVGNVEALAEVLGRSRVVGGLSYHSGAVRGPGHVSHTHAGATWLGELDGRPSDRVERLAADLAAAGFQPVVVDNIMGHIWTKFVHNTAINAVAALLGLRVGEISTTAGADALQTRIIEEALAVVRAKGIRLVDDDPMASIKEFCTLKFNKPSMLQHLEAGKRTEVDALNGAVVRYGLELNIPTPYNESLMWMVKGMEEHRRRLAADGPFDYEALEAEAQRRASAA
jgi:2-dehydropantoate 2-reductase